MTRVSGHVWLRLVKQLVSLSDLMWSLKSTNSVAPGVMIALDWFKLNSWLYFQAVLLFLFELVNCCCNLLLSYQCPLLFLVLWLQYFYFRLIMAGSPPL